MPKSSINVGPDPGPDQTIRLSPKKQALLAIVHLKKQLADLERTVRGIQEAKPAPGVSVTVHPEPKRRVATTS